MHKLDFTNTCIVSGTSDNLNTFFTVKVDDVTYEVALCDEHEDTTPKEVRRLIGDKIKEFNTICETLAQFGYKAVPIDETVKSIQPKSETTTEQPKSAPQTQESPLKKNEIQELPPVDVGKVTSSGNMGTIQPEHYIPDSVANKDGTPVKRPAVEHQELQIAESESGRPISAPKTVRDQSGETTYVIAPTSHEELMRRSNVATKREHSYQKGYAFRDCPLCGGVGQHRKNTCPKCKGTGII